MGGPCPGGLALASTLLSADTSLPYAAIDPRQTLNHISVEVTQRRNSFFQLAVFLLNLLHHFDVVKRHTFRRLRTPGDPQTPISPLSWFDLTFCRAQNREALGFKKAKRRPPEVFAKIFLPKDALPLI
ncbi:hypothetical protein [Neomoorella thermoacetica]|uniref:hypothetical protein n=1 Tax=Neomoorella thermoacetica TaxID=1525 RepID=UPI0011E69F7F|nr:hypothetical protein [Moorella thermoacetica]